MNKITSRSVIGEFYRKLAVLTGASWISAVTMYFDSDQPEEEYAWLGQSPAMREWIGGRAPKGLSENSIKIANKIFESTLKILVDDIRRDKTGQIKLRIYEQARRAVSHWASLLSTLILNGANGVCYDGQYFFDTDHVEGDSGSQSNKINVDISALPTNQHGSIIAPSPEEMELTILQGVSQILSFKDNEGEPLNEDAKNFIVMVPVSLYITALTATVNPVLTSGKTNTIAKSDLSITPVSNARLSSWTDKFVIMRADGDVKAFIRQEEEGVKIEALTEGSEHAFKNREHLYGISAVRNVGYGYWQNACQITMT